MKGRLNPPARIALLTVFSVAFLFAFVFPTSSYLAQARQVSRTRHDLGILREQNRALAKEDAKLQTNAEIERIARERYNMALPGERLFSIVPTAPATTTTTTAPTTTSTTATTPTSTVPSTTARAAVP
jgi:cell division protein FtsB